MSWEDGRVGGWKKLGEAPMSLERWRGRPRLNVGRASPPVRLPKTAWKLGKLQGEALVLALVPP